MPTLRSNDHVPGGRRLLKSRRTLRRLRASRRHLNYEPLETRTVLTAISLIDAPQLDLTQQFAEPAISSLATVTNPTPTGYTPAQIAQAYGFSGITFSGGTIKGDGTGQTIAIVDAYNHPNIVSDLHAFDAAFGLADPPKFTVVNQTGGTKLPATNAGWAQEIALDVEWAHAMAPGANILLVEANSSSLADLLAAVDYARNAAGVSVVSMSWGSSEFSTETRYDQYFTTPSGHTGVSFVASAGDSGAQALWPAISTNVLSVGGTALNTVNGTYSSESAWSGSGGGYSRYIAEPSYQSSVQSSGMRTGPDVSYDASPNTGFAVYDTVSINGKTGWFQVGGTSAGAPQWAAIVAIADQGRALSGKSTISNVQSLVYSLSTSDFHDVTTGSNGYAARAGYDLVTGRGTPIASSVVRDLSGNGTTSTTTTTGQTTSTQSTSTQTVVYYEWIYWNHHWWRIPITSAIRQAVSSEGDSNIDEFSGAELADSELTDVSTSLVENGAALPNAPAASSGTVSGGMADSPANAMEGFVTTILMPVSQSANGAGIELAQATDVANDVSPHAGESQLNETQRNETQSPDRPTIERDTTPEQSTHGLQNGGEPATATESEAALLAAEGFQWLEAACDACFGDEPWQVTLDASHGKPVAVWHDWREIDVAAIAVAAVIAGGYQAKQRNPSYLARALQIDWQEEINS